MIFFCGYVKNKYLCPPIYGDVAQLVEQRTENPCVGGSIPSITTLLTERRLLKLPFVFYANWQHNISDF